MALELADLPCFPSTAFYCYVYLPKGYHSTWETAVGLDLLTLNLFGPCLLLNTGHFYFYDYILQTKH
jgi:hypothetical protein